MSVIEIEGLHYAYPPVLPGGGPAQVLRGVELAVERGEFLALMGATGAGKTTLCLALNGLVPRATGGVIRGQVRVLGHNTRQTPTAELAAQVGLVYQDPESQLFCATVEDELAFGPENLALDRQEIADRVAWALDVVAMSDHRLRSPAQLSGGQKQRVAIAASLAMLPEVLILDEPTSSLDPVGQNEVFAVIERLCRERRMTIVMVSHDAERVAQFADRVAVLHQGRIVADDTPWSVFERADLLREAGLAAPQVTEIALALNRSYGVGFRFTRLDEAETMLAAHLSPPDLTPQLPLHSRGEEAVDSPSPPMWRGGGGVRSGEPQPAPCIRVENAYYQYDPELPALNGVSIEIAEGAFLAIVGQNGSGKTTLVKHFNGLLRPTAGRVWVQGVDTAHATVGQLAHTVGYVFQNPDHQIFCATTREELMFGPRNLGLPAKVVAERAEEALRLFGLTAYADLPPAVLGYGVRRVVSIAAVWTMQPRVWILDEPTAGLDARSAQELMDLAEQLHAEGRTIILVSHDMRLVAQHAREVLVMHEGRVLARGAARQVFAQADLLAQAQLAAPQVMQLARRLAPYGLRPDCLTVDELVAAYTALRPAAAASEPRL